MGYYTSVHGELTIEPPLAWNEFRDSPFAVPRKHEIWLAVEEESKQTTEGVLTVKRATRVVTWDESFKAYEFDGQLQKLVDAFPGHTFAGLFEGEGEENDDMWRVRVRNGNVERIKPRIVWPDEA